MQLLVPHRSLSDSPVCPAGADDFDSFVTFVETIVGKGFISLLDSLMQKIIIDILRRAGDSSEWAGGYSLPGAVLQTATHALVNLSDIQSRSSAADFLAGGQHPHHELLADSCTGASHYWHILWWGIMAYGGIPAILPVTICTLHSMLCPVFCWRAVLRCAACMCHKDFGVCAASDHVTRILKEYGDVLDKYQLAPDKADVGKELRVLRCLLLLIKLTGFLTTIFASLRRFAGRHVLPSFQCRAPSMATIRQSMA